MDDPDFMVLKSYAIGASLRERKQSLFAKFSEADTDSHL